MKFTTISTVLMSVFLSVGITLLVIGRQKTIPTSLLKVRNIALVDDNGNVRATIGMTQVDGHQEPQIRLVGENGSASVLLSVNRRGEGTLYFSSPKTEGKVAVGYIWGSDTYDSDEPDPLGMWGLRVLGANGQDKAFGIGNEGKPVLPSK